MPEKLYDTIAKFLKNPDQRNQKALEFFNNSAADCFFDKIATGKV